MSLLDNWIKTKGDKNWRTYKTRKLKFWKNDKLNFESESYCIKMLELFEEFCQDEIIKVGEEYQDEIQKLCD